MEEKNTKKRHKKFIALGSLAVVASPVIGASISQGTNSNLSLHQDDLYGLKANVVQINGGDYLVKNNFEIVEDTLIPISTPSGALFKYKMPDADWSPATPTGLAKFKGDIEIKLQARTGYEITGTQSFVYTIGSSEIETIDASLYLKASNFTVENGAISPLTSPKNGVFEYSLDKTSWSSNAPGGLLENSHVYIRIFANTGVAVSGTNLLDYVVAKSPSTDKTIDGNKYLVASNFTIGSSSLIAISTPSNGHFEYSINYGSSWSSTSPSGLDSAKINEVRVKIVPDADYTVTGEQLLVTTVGTASVATKTHAGKISNYDMSAVKPIPASSAIDYTKSSYTPWFDDGFSWQQFLEGAEVGKTVIDKMLQNGSDLINLGFITSYDSLATSSSSSPVVSALSAWAKDRVTDYVVPTVGGVLPLWMSNWTDAWGANTPGDHQTGSSVYKFLNEIRNAGKDYVFSFGGWNHDSLAMDAAKKNYNAADLADLYLEVIKSFDMKVIDFDIEGTEDGKTDDYGNVGNVEQGEKAKALRIEAIRILKQKMPSLIIRATLPTILSGSDAERYIGLLKDQSISSIDLMSMDFAYNSNLIGSEKRVSLPGELAVYAISAINALARQIEAAGIENPYSKIGATTMLGINDVKNEVWTLTDQIIFTNFAITKQLGRIYSWESNYDMEQHLYNANSGALRPGHNFGDLWTFDEMTGKTTRAKDSYATGLYTKDLSYASISWNFASKTIVNVGSISQLLVDELNKLGFGSITTTDLSALYNSNYVFSNNKGLSEASITIENSRQALQDELNKFSSSANAWQYLNTNLIYN